MEGLEIPEDLRAKLMAHLGVSGETSITKIVSRFQVHDKYHHNSGMFIVQGGWMHSDICVKEHKSLYISSKDIFCLEILSHFLIC